MKISQFKFFEKIKLITGCPTKFKNLKKYFYNERYVFIEYF